MPNYSKALSLKQNLHIKHFFITGVINHHFSLRSIYSKEKGPKYIVGQRISDLIFLKLK